MFLRLVTVADDPVTVRLTDIIAVSGADKDMLRSTLLTRYQGHNLIKNMLFKHDATLPKRVKDAMKESDLML